MLAEVCTPNRSRRVPSNTRVAMVTLVPLILSLTGMNIQNTVYQTYSTAMTLLGV